MDDMKKKLQSDRLWMAAAFLILVALNAQMAWGLEMVPEGATSSPLALAAYVAIAFVLGKSVRGTVAGSFLEAMTSKAADDTSSEDTEDGPADSPSP